MNLLLAGGFTVVLALIRQESTNHNILLTAPYTYVFNVFVVL